MEDNKIEWDNTLKIVSIVRERISLQKEKYKKQQDARIIKPQETYVSGDLVKFMNQAPSNKLSPSWKGPATILEEIGNNNYKIIFDNKTQSIHANQLMPYYI